MALKVRQMVAAGGPDGQSSWIDSGESLPFAALTASSTPTQLPVCVIPTADKQLAGGAPAFDSIASGQPIMRLNGAQIAFVTALGAQTHLQIGISVYRANTQVGGQDAFGWLQAGGSTPAFSALTSVALPALTGNTSLVTPTGGSGSYMLMRPGDIVVVEFSTDSSTVSVPAGVISLLGA